MTTYNKNPDKNHNKNDNINPSEAASKLRSNDSSSKEKHDAAVILGREGGHQSHDRSKKENKDDQGEEE